MFYSTLSPVTVMLDSLLDRKYSGIREDDLSVIVKILPKLNFKIKIFSWFNN